MTEFEEAATASSRRLPREQAEFGQLTLPMAAPIPVNAQLDGLTDHGEVFTRRWVVDLILDLVGYTPDRDLANSVAIEPSCGSGAFVVPMVERLLASIESRGQEVAESHSAIQATDLLPRNVVACREKVLRVLEASNISAHVRESLVASWLGCDDFLLNPAEVGSADFVVGNPPYLRLEAVPDVLSDAYRQACTTMSGRADVYVGFYEHGLRALQEGGSLGFICADRWMRNSYGARLRALVSSAWSVDVVMPMTGIDAFEDEVDAYPAITIISRQPQITGPLIVETEPSFDSLQAPKVVAAASAPPGTRLQEDGFRSAHLKSWFVGMAGWPSGSPERLDVLAELESALPSLEDEATGTRVGIGVASGADKVFIVDKDHGVEPERLMPLASPRDISGGRVAWRGKMLVNPWDTNGLVALEDWPGFAAYLGGHREQLEKRHTARRGNWHKTIDRVSPALLPQAKLYLPDFKEHLFPVRDDGETYPHHNLYWITSESWDLRVLGGLLMSDIANMFIEAYSVRMRGGFLRFQAQYLRKIRVPALGAISAADELALATAFEERDRVAASKIALRVYNVPELPR